MIRKTAIAVLAIVVLFVALLVVWASIDGQPLPDAATYLKGAGYTAAEGEDGSFVFTPEAPNGHGIVIMHGALIKPLSYAKTAAFFARRGYTVFVPCGAARLSITAVDGAAARLDSFGVQDWFLIGHSMGGMSSLELLLLHPANVRAVALWATAMPKSYANLTAPMLFLRGDKDGLLPPDRFKDAQGKLPAATRYVTVPGGNHQGFAMYSHQFFDSAATIGWREQIDFADEKTAAFFAEHTPGPGL